MAVHSCKIALALALGMVLQGESLRLAEPGAEPLELRASSKSTLAQGGYGLNGDEKMFVDAVRKAVENQKRCGEAYNRYFASGGQSMEATSCLNSERELQC